MVDRRRRKGYSLSYLYGLFSVPAPPLRTRERRGFFSKLLARQEFATAKPATVAVRPSQGHLDWMENV
jgi:hypothetical protein